MKKSIIILTIFSMLLTSFSIIVAASGMEDVEDNISIENTGLDASEIMAKSAVLMDAETGTLLYAKNPNESLPPASVTKIMTLLLVAEAIANKEIDLYDKVTVSNYASSMGGSQIFIEEGEEFTVEDLLKSTIIASANDAAVALAELVAGSESEFVKKMNDKAKEIGMNNTYFENTTGLDDDVNKHLTSAFDIALMSRELIKHDIILKYSTLWQDSIRSGEFILTNTNRLVRYYQGCTGLKTGSTDKAGYCISATAKRNGMHLIAVIMGSETRDERNASARTLLDWGFANYSLYAEAESPIEEIDIYKGNIDTCQIVSRGIKLLLPKSEINKIEKKYIIPDYVTAPLTENQAVGKIEYYIDDKKIGEAEIIISENINKLTPLSLFLRIISKIVN